MIESKGYKITPIDGDLAVSRNAEIGRDVDIQGKARVAGSLKVEGFLDAPHIKGAAKGLFNSVEELTREYPNPRPGWFAIVLDATNKEKGILYKAENRGWVATTDEARPYEFIKDSINVFASKGEFASTEEELLKRLQGVSENSNASTDPFRYLGNLSKTKFFETIDALNGDSAASREECAGHFRAAVEHRIVDVYSEQIGWENNVWVQRMVCPMQLFNKVAQIKKTYTKTGVDKDGNVVSYTYMTHTYTQEFDTLTGASTKQNTVKTYTRTCNNGVWGDWKDVSNNYINSQNYGKKIAFFGGSFAQNMSLTSTPWSFDYQGRTYSLMQYVAEKLGATSFDDYAVGSQGVIVGDIPIIEQLQTAGAGYDIYVIFGGINDFGNETPLGESNGAANDTTYCGGLKAAFDWIRSNNKSAKIYTVTPFKAYTPDDRYWNPRSNIKKKGHTFYEFIQAQKEVAQIHGVPCFDLWANQQFSGASASEYYYTDLLHPNGKGYQAVADALVEFLAYGLGSGVLDAYAVLPNATDTAKGLMSAEDKKKIVKSITWNNDTDPSNMNDFVVAGVYDIKGERTRIDDNLPILNTGGGHSFNARLTVLDSSISGSGNNDDKCITQVLSFSNRLGQGEAYIRTGKGSSLYNLTWEKWSTLQRNVNVGQVYTLDDLIDNGIYSGVYSNTITGPEGGPVNVVETFVLIVINDYAVSGQAGLPRNIIQLKYAVDTLTGQSSVKKRVGTGNDSISWGGWEILNKNEIASMISAEIKKVTDGIDPDKIDSIKDIITWIEEHGDVANIFAVIEGLYKELNREIDARKIVDNDTRSKGVLFGGFSNRQTTAAEVLIGYQSIDQKSEGVFNIPAATTEKAGVMSAADKAKLDNLSEGRGGDITAVPTDVVIEEIEPNLVSTAIRKTPQVLTEGEKEIARENIGAADAEKTSIAITTNETNINNEVIRAKQAEADAIEKGRQLALRSLFIAAGAEYNDTDQVIKKTAPWGTEETWVKNADGTYTYSEVPAIVDHLPKHYYLNGLGDITEEQMMTIYNAGTYKGTANYYAGYNDIRTFLPAKISGQEGYGSFQIKSACADCKNIEVVCFSSERNLTEQYGISNESPDISSAFCNCKNLKYIQEIGLKANSAVINTFNGCRELVWIKLFKLAVNLSLAASSKISKKSIRFVIQKAKPTSAITITLHPDAYARLADDADIVAALAAQPLVTLVSA